MSLTRSHLRRKTSVKGLGIGSMETGGNLPSVPHALDGGRAVCSISRSPDGEEITCGGG